MVVLFGVERLILVLGLFSFSPVAKAQGTPGLPACAQACGTAAAAVAVCALRDTSCLCASNFFLTETLHCSSFTCSSDDQSTATRYLQSMCNLVTTTTSPTSGTPGTSTGTFTGSITINDTVTTASNGTATGSTATTSASATVTITAPPTTTTTGRSSISSSSTNRNTTTVAIQTVPATSSSSSGSTGSASGLAYGGASRTLNIGLIVLGLMNLW